jgi:hypothetical protein
MVHSTPLIVVFVQNGENVSETRFAYNREKISAHLRVRRQFSFLFETGKMWRKPFRLQPSFFYAKQAHRSSEEGMQKSKNVSRRVLVVREKEREHYCMLTKSVSLQR